MKPKAKTKSSEKDDLILALISAAEALHHSGWTRQAGDLKHWAWKLESRADCPRAKQAASEVARQS